MKKISIFLFALIFLLISIYGSISFKYYEEDKADFISVCIISVPLTLCLIYSISQSINSLLTLPEKIKKTGSYLALLICGGLIAFNLLSGTVHLINSRFGHQEEIKISGIIQSKHEGQKIYFLKIHDKKRGLIKLYTTGNITKLYSAGSPFNDNLKQGCFDILYKYKEEF